MSLIVKDNGSGGGFTPAPEGQFQAVCVDVVDLGISKKIFNGKEKEVDELRIVFQLRVTDANGGEIRTDEGHRFIVSRTFTKSLSEKSNLRPFLESWRGRKFVKEELDGFDVEKLLNVNALVQIVHNVSAKNGNTYANVQAIMPINPAFNLQTLTPENYTRHKDKPANAPAPQPQASAPVSFIPPARAFQSSPLPQDEIPF